MKTFQRIYINLFVICVVVGVLSTCCSSLWARPTTAQEAEELIAGWLKADPKPLGTSLGQQVRKVDTFTNQSDEPIYYIVYLRPSGFVIVSADDLIEPIIGFGLGNSFDPSPENPLGALVTKDLTDRIAAVRGTYELRSVDNQPLTSESQRKWRNFIQTANTPKDKNSIVLMSVGVNSISDVRVAPLVKSKWGQRTISEWSGGTVGGDCPLPCYNYYTPYNYPCGCPATALAQLMRYYEYPTTGIGVHEFTIRVGGTQVASTRGGDGSGGPYNWDSIPYEPNCDSTEVQRQAIGALCYDAGVSMNQRYNADASGWAGCTCDPIKQAITITFLYGNAVHGYAGESPIGEGLTGMINPNLDARKPVILSTKKHAFVCDGYGYNDSVLYHHLNMGVLGIDDIWYELSTNLISPLDHFDYGPVCSCVYNVQTLPAGDGEIISGRVLDHNVQPIAYVVIYVTSNGEFIAETETDDKGIYAFDCLESNTAYTINAALRGYGFSSQMVTTGISQDNSVISGNLWSVDLVGLFCDFNSDQKVDAEDMVMLVEHWGQDYPDFDVAPSPSGDGIVDVQDLIVLAEHFFEEVDDPTLVAHWPMDETEGMYASDSVGENNAIVIGGATWQPSGGQKDGAIQLDGISGCAIINPILNPADGPFSIVAWINGCAPGQVVVSQQGAANWLRANTAGNLMTELIPTAGRSPSPPLVSETMITNGEWHRIGFVWDGTHRTLFVDGVVVAEDTQNGLASSNNGLYIGCGKGMESGTYFSGLIDDVRIYNKALCVDEIAALSK